MAIDVLFAGIPVAELAPALDWYQRFFGRPPDLVPNELERVWQLTDNGWVYVVEDEKRAGNGLTTLIVEDLDESLAELRQRGIAIGEIEQLNERTRVLQLADPDGNRLQLGEVSSAD